MCLLLQRFFTFSCFLAFIPHFYVIVLLAILLMIACGHDKGLFVTDGQISTVGIANGKWTLGIEIRRADLLVHAEC
jgi:hypothetical protein